MKVLNILDKDQLAHINRLLKDIEFEDGIKSARGLAKKAKKNQEAKVNGDSYIEASKSVSYTHLRAHGPY